MQILEEIYKRLTTLPRGRRKVRRVYKALLQAIQLYDHPAIDQSEIDTRSLVECAKRARDGMEVLAVYANTDRQAAKILALCETILSCDTPYPYTTDRHNRRGQVPAYERVLGVFADVRNL